MAFPDEVLTADERVILHFRPHWKVMVGPIAYLILGLGLIVAALSWNGNQAAVLVAVVLGLVIIVWLAVWPALEWLSTHYVFTNERVVFRTGVLSRHRRDIPLGRINDHSTQQTMLDRVLGTGTLTLESAGEHGQSVLTGVPHVDVVQTRLYEIIDGEGHNRH